MAEETNNLKIETTLGKISSSVDSLLVSTTRTEDRDKLVLQRIQSLGAIQTNLKMVSKNIEDILKQKKQDEKQPKKIKESVSPIKKIDEKKLADNALLVKKLTEKTLVDKALTIKKTDEKKILEDIRKKTGQITQIISPNKTTEKRIASKNKEIILKLDTITKEVKPIKKEVLKQFNILKKRDDEEENIYQMDMEYYIREQNEQLKNAIIIEIRRLLGSGSTKKDPVKEKEKEKEKKGLLDSLKSIIPSVLAGALTALKGLGALALASLAGLGTAALAIGKTALKIVKGVSALKKVAGLGKKVKSFFTKKKPPVKKLSRFGKKPPVKKLKSFRLGKKPPKTSRISKILKKPVNLLKKIKPSKIPGGSKILGVLAKAIKPVFSILKAVGGMTIVIPAIFALIDTVGILFKEKNVTKFISKFLSSFVNILFVELIPAIADLATMGIEFILVNLLGMDPNGPVITTIKKVNEWIQKIGKGVGGFVGAFFDWLIDGGSSQKMIDSFIGVMETAVVGIFGEGFFEDMMKVWSDFEEPVKNTFAQIKKIWDLVTGVFGQGEALGPGGYFMTTALPFLKDMYAFLKPIVIDGFKDFLIERFRSALKIFTGVGGIVGGLFKMFDGDIAGGGRDLLIGAENILGGLLETFLAMPKFIFKIVAAVGDAIFGTTWMTTMYNSVNDILQFLFDGDMFLKINSLIGLAFDKLTLWFMENIKVPDMSITYKEVWGIGNVPAGITFDLVPLAKAETISKQKEKITLSENIIGATSMKDEEQKMKLLNESIAKMREMGMEDSNVSELAYSSRSKSKKRIEDKKIREEVKLKNEQIEKENIQKQNIEKDQLTKLRQPEIEDEGLTEEHIDNINQNMGAYTEASVKVSAEGTRAVRNDLGVIRRELSDIKKQQTKSNFIRDNRYGSQAVSYA